MNIETGSDRGLQAMIRNINDLDGKKIDFNVNTGRHLSINTDRENNPVIHAEIDGLPTQHFYANDVARDQIFTHADINQNTAQSLLDRAPAEFCSVINKLWHDSPSDRILRAYDGAPAFHGVADYNVLRGYVSNKFLRFDHTDVLNNIMPLITDGDHDYSVTAATLTDRNMRVTFRSNAIQGSDNRAVGDVMALGFVISNSEVGLGSLSLQELIITLACLNGMMSTNVLSSIRAKHLTSSISCDGSHGGVIPADITASQIQAKDLYRSAVNFLNNLSSDTLQDHIEKMNTARSDVIEDHALIVAPSDPQADDHLVDRITKYLGVPRNKGKTIRQEITNARVQRGYINQPLSRATLIQAVTALQHKNADHAEIWQRNGAKMLAMTSNAFNNYIAQPIAA
tara:strand:+ start:841 stop:2034 length:1194 start_codon:yes stop_codon:yes gene_type:complete